MITFGRHGGEENLLLDRAELEARGVETVKTDRGGNITCHFPGQLVAYPVFRVGKRTNGLHGFVRTAGRNRHPHRRRVRGRGRPAGKAAPAYGSATASCARSACACATGCPSTALRSTWGTIFPFSAPLPWCGLHDAEATSLSRECGDDSLSMQEVKDVCTREFQTLFADPPVAPC